MDPLSFDSEPDRYEDAHLTLDFTNKVARLDQVDLVLTRKELELLVLLVRNAGEIIHRDALLWQVWGYNNQIRTRTLDVHIRRLRKKLGAYSEHYIETIFGVGYRFQPWRASRSFPVSPRALPLAIGA